MRRPVESVHRQGALARARPSSTLEAVMKMQSLRIGTRLGLGFGLVLLLLAVALGLSYRQIGAVGPHIDLLVELQRVGR